MKLYPSIQNPRQLGYLPIITTLVTLILSTLLSLQVIYIIAWSSRELYSVKHDLLVERDITDR